MLVELIDSLIDEVGAGINDATIRTRLLTLREQAEAIEVQLKQVNADLEQARSYLQRLQIDVQDGKVVTEQETIKDVTVKLLQLLSREGDRPTLEEVAKQLGVKQVDAQYHANALAKKGMIRMVAYVGERGTVYIVTDKGTAYLVENKLAWWAPGAWLDGITS